MWTGRADNVVKLNGRKISLDALEEELSEILETTVACQRHIEDPGGTIEAFVISNNEELRIDK